jgi:hypothetical protein
MKNNAWITKILISLVGKPQLRAFERSSKNVKSSQEALLFRQIASCRNTAFGKDHKFNAIKSVDEFRAAVPVRGFEEHRPYIDRMCRGEADVLFPGKPFFYNTTSGTTGKPKMIPVSKNYFETTYQGLSRLWFYSCLKDNARLFHGKSLSAVSPAVEGTVEDGTPYGSISGATYRNIPPVLKKTYSTPYPVICIKDYVKKYYAMMRCGLAADITYVICPSPSNLIQFHRIVSEHFEDLVRDIRDGTLRKDVADALDPSSRAETLATFAPDKKRAAFLEALLKTHGENLRPRHYWPNCACVNTWKEGNFARIIPMISGYYDPSTPVRSFGYQASEARAGLVLGNDWDYSALATHVYHFEFVPEERREAKNPATLLAHELSQGKRYFILITNGSGLYRYDIDDMVEVTGFYNQVPLFRFLQKGEGITSLTGEKLSEMQVSQAIDEVCAASGAPLAFFMLFCDENALVYRLYAEFAHETTERDRQLFLERFDKTLCVLNREYDAKRKSSRLAMPLFYECKADSRERFKENVLALGLGRDGQYKESTLVKNPVLLAILENLRKQDG